MLCAVAREAREALRAEREGDADGGQAADGGSLGKRLRKANDALALSSVFHMPQVPMSLDEWPKLDVARSFRFADQSNLGNVGAPELVSASLADHDEPGKELVIQPPRRMGAYSAVFVQVTEAINTTQHLVGAGVARPPAPAGVAPAVAAAAAAAPAGGAAARGRGRRGAAGRGAGGAAGAALEVRMAAARHAEGSIGLWEAVSAPATIKRWSKEEACEATRGFLTISKGLRLLAMRNKRVWEKMKDSALTMAHPKWGDIHWFCGLWTAAMDALKVWLLGVLKGEIAVNLLKWSTTAPTNVLVLIGLGVSNEGCRQGEVGAITRPVWAAIKAAEATTALAIEEVGGVPGVAKARKGTDGGRGTGGAGGGGGGGGGAGGGAGAGGRRNRAARRAAAAAANGTLPPAMAAAHTARVLAAAATTDGGALARHQPETDPGKLRDLRAAILGRNDVDSITRKEVMTAHLCFSCKNPFHGRTPCVRRGTDMPPPGR